LTLFRTPSLLALALVSAALGAQEPAPKPSESKPVVTPEAKAEPAPEKASQSWASHHYHHRSTFGAYAQASFPQRELKEALADGQGYGLGLQWTHDRGDWNASRTRLEWNTFAEGSPVAPLSTRTYAKNYLVSWDHLFKLNQGPYQSYAVMGLGGARWNLEQTTSLVRRSLWTTKLAFTGGLGLRLGERVNVEARYVVSSIEKTYDGNALQASLGWRF
jgi:hypothetical protein